MQAAFQLRSQNGRHQAPVRASTISEAPNRINVIKSTLNIVFGSGDLSNRYPNTRPAQTNHKADSI